ncbi:hypothetical protein LCGC14_1977770 [marine sediment metagenome]|uniref:Uncharacterized protein n=1 Tax=marine sediment metagenome TaxID=412755 RepID=A0A0F9FA48_9ZZZZ
MQTAPTRGRRAFVASALCACVGCLGCLGQPSGPGRPGKQEAAFISRVATFLDQGGDIGAAGEGDRTLLHEAVAKGYLHAVKLLLRSGAPLGATDRWGFTPLSRAASLGNGELVRLLLAAGADPNIGTPLVSAASGGDASMVRQLLAHKASPDLADETGSALGYASEGGHTEVVRLLLQAGADPNKPSDGELPAELAASEGHFGTVRMLLSKGAKRTVNVAASLGELAFVRRHFDIQQIRAAEKAGQPTALHYAATNGQEAVARYVLGQGADIDASAWNFTALDMAAERGHLGMIELLLSHKPENVGQALIWAAYGYQPKAIELLLDRGVPVDSKAAGNALCTAAEKGYLPIVKVLVKRGVNVNSRDEFEFSPLHWCVIQGVGAILTKPNGPQEYLEVAKYLLGKGAAVNAGDVSEKTPLDGIRDVVAVAGDARHKEMIRLLRKHGARTSAELVGAESRPRQEARP